MRFYALGSQSDPPPDADFPCVVLGYDRWDDFGYKTQRDLAYYDADRNLRLREGVKIMRTGVSSPWSLELRAKFDALPADFCSLGQSLDYYRAFGRLGREVWEPILRALNDVVVRKTYRGRFEAEDAFQTSLLRFSEAKKALEVGWYYLTGDEAGAESTAAERRRLFTFAFTTTVPGASAPHALALDFAPQPTGLHRVAAIIGRNGTGKTQVLASLATALARGGEEAGDSFAPDRPDFSHVIAVSFSVFDDFERPVPSTSFSYTYLGLRLPPEAAPPLLPDWTNPLRTDRGGAVATVPAPPPTAAGSGEQIAEPDGARLLTQVELRRRVEVAMARVHELGREGDWRALLNTLFGEDVNVDGLIGTAGLNVAAYALLSSGQRVLLHVLTGLVARIEREAVVLFDEPEIHLHPNALARLTRALHELLERFDSYAVIATHSPQVLQEVPGRMVRVFRREGTVPSVEPLGAESFGESVAALTDRVFEVTPSEQNYRAYLARLAVGRSVGEVESLFEPLGLSMHARMYLHAHARASGDRSIGMDATQDEGVRAPSGPTAHRKQ